MGRLYSAEFPDGTERVVASFSTERAEMFYEIARLVEARVVPHPCGIKELPYDEYAVDPGAFVRFFERFWEKAKRGDGVEMLYGWAGYAAGLVENITLAPGIWTNARGEVLQPRRFELSDPGLEAAMQERLAKRDRAIEGLPRL